MGRILRGRGAHGRNVRGRGARGHRPDDGLPYQAIQDLNLTLFTQFKYPVYNGNQVLFRDVVCTMPVTEPGNHTIAAALDPFTLELVFIQPDNAKQPLWTGVDAKFDGIDDCFNYARDLTDFDYFLHTGNGAMFVWAEPVMYNGTWFNNERSSNQGVIFGSWVGYSARVSYRTPTQGRILVLGVSDFYSLADDPFYTYGFSVNSGETTFFRGGNLFPTSGTFVPEPSLVTDPNAIEFIGQGGAERYDGSVAGFGIFNRPLSPSEIAIINGVTP